MRFKNKNFTLLNLRKRR